MNYKEKKLKGVTSLAFIGCMLLSVFLYGQDDRVGITMRFEPLSTVEEINDIFLIEGIEGYRMIFTGEELIDKHYILTVKEFWNGTVTAVDTIMNTRKYNDLLKIKDDSLLIKVISKSLSDDRIKVIFTFPKVRSEKYFKSTGSDDYSLRKLTSQKNLPIQIDDAFYVLSHILPYEKDEIKNWCTVDQNGEDIENWGLKFGLDHYLTYQLVFVH
jgi:hypothetical protein